jgi:pimeloyl-ACP methyl ester carboxylesterase
MVAGERAKLLDQRLTDIAAGALQMAEKRAPRLLGPEAAPDALRRAIEVMATMRPDGYGQAARMLSMADVKADIVRLPVAMPVQFIYGDADIITPPVRNLEVAALRPTAPVHVIAGVGHALYLEKPKDFNAIVQAFVSAHES